MWSISPKIILKTENDTVGSYRFGLNFDSKFYVRKQVCWPWAQVGVALVWTYEKIKIKGNILKTQKNGNY